MEVSRDLLDKSIHAVMNCFRVDQVIIVNNQDQRGLETGEIVNYRSEQRVKRNRRPCQECGLGFFTDLPVKPSQSGQEMRPKAVKVIVRLIQRKPGQW